MASSAASSKRKRQYACGSIDDCGDPLDDNAMSLVVRWPTHTTDPTLFVLLFTHTKHTSFSSFFLSLGRVKVVTTRDERESFFVFFFLCVVCFVFCVFFFVRDFFSFFCVCLFDTQRYTS